MPAANANVWTQMGYAPPRGPCNYKQGVLSPRCPCLRFMLHPLKSTSSFECDGCAHHASFHSMENKAEDEIRKRWEVEAREKKDEERPRKRVRALEYAEGSDAGARTGRSGATGTRARGRITEVDDEVVEVD